MLCVDCCEFRGIEPSEVTGPPELREEIEEFARRGEIFQCYMLTINPEDPDPEPFGTSTAVYFPGAGRIRFQYEDYVAWYDAEEGRTEEGCTEENDENMAKAITVWLFELRALLQLEELCGAYNDAVYTQLARAVPKR